VVPNVPKSNTYAFLKGCVDGGLEIPHSAEMLPEDSRLNGEHIANYAATLKSQAPQKYSQLFSKYLSAGVEPENIKTVVVKVMQDLDKLVGEKKCLNKQNGCLEPSWADSSKRVKWAP